MPPIREPRRRAAPGQRAGARPDGFSLVELMVTLAVAAVFLALAAPSMSEVFNGNRVLTEASAFVSDLRLARVSAIQQGLPVSLCPSADGSHCIASSQWQQGWIVFTDLNGNGSVDSGDTLLRVRQAFRGSDSFGATAGTQVVTFNREGFTSNLGAATVMFQLHTTPSASSLARCVAIDLGGRVNTLRVGGTSGGVTCG